MPTTGYKKWFKTIIGSLLIVISLVEMLYFKIEQQTFWITFGIGCLFVFMDYKDIAEIIRNKLK